MLLLVKKHSILSKKQSKKYIIWTFYTSYSKIIFSLRIRVITFYLNLISIKVLRLNFQEIFMKLFLSARISRIKNIITCYSYKGDAKYN